MPSSLSGVADKVGLTCEVEVQLVRYLHNEPTEKQTQMQRKTRSIQD